MICDKRAPDIQIIRDHLISHILAAIADWTYRDHVTFFGGTALCRTWLPDNRLSEDMALLVESPSDSDGLRSRTSRRLRREFPNLAWTRLGSQHLVETWSGPRSLTTSRSGCSSLNGTMVGRPFRS